MRCAVSSQSIYILPKSKSLIQHRISAAGGLFFIKVPYYYKGTITKAGYETVSTTVQFAPDVNVEQDLEMTPSAPPAATGSVTGTVTDSVTALGIGGVLVQSDSGGVMVITDAAGNYTLTNLPVGLRTIIFSKTGYVSQQQVVNVTEGGTVIMNVALVPEP
jgi:outer membrane receptor for ferrienterochelin and colicins